MKSISNKFKMVSKSVWNLPGGPWERIFAGVWHRFNVAVYENEDKVLLTTIFPKSGEVNWIMVRADRILLVPEGFEKIEDSLQTKNLHVLKQRVPDKHMTYLMLLSPPTTVEFGSKEIGSKVFQKVLSLEEDVEEIKSIAKKAGVEIIDLKDAPYKESANLLGNPTTLMSLLSIAPEGEEPKKQKLREIVMGEAEGGLFKVDETMLNSFISIKKGTEEERNYLAQAIMEDVIIDASPIPVILDFGKYPLKLEQANPYPYDYSKFGFSSNNVGFKVEYYDLAADDCPIKINLNHVSVQFLWKLFGLGTDETSTKILETAHKLQQLGNMKGIDDIIEALGDSERAQRLLRAVKRSYGNIFSKDTDTRKIILDWIQGNKSVYISMSELDKHKRLAFMLYLLETVENLKESDMLSKIEEKRVEQILLCVLDTAWFGEGVVQSEIIDKIITDFGRGLFVNEEALPMQIESRVANRFHILAPKRAKLFIGGRGTEFDVRPLLSCPP